MSEEADYLTVEEVAESLRVAVPTVRAWIAAGELPAYRFGGKLLRIARPDFEVFLVGSKVS